MRPAGTSASPPAVRRARIRPGRALAALTTLALALALPPGFATQDPEPEAQETPSEEETLLGRPSAFGLEQTAEKRIWVEAGRRIHQRPDPRSSVLDLVDAAAELPVLERRGPWARVRYGAWQGWVVVEGEEDLAVLPSEPAPLKRPDRERRARLRRILGEDHAARRLGPYTLFSDVENGALLERLGAVAAHLGATYRERFGLDPGPPGEETIFIFAREEDYRAYEREEPAAARLGAPGHASHGLCVTFVGDQTADQMRHVLIHELTHLLNRRALGSEVAPWLEEGLAEALASSRVDRSGRILPEALGGTTKVQGLSGGRRLSNLQLVTVTGSRAALRTLLEAWHEATRPSLSQLLSLGWDEFVDPRGREIHYAQSGLLVRYLLDGRGGEAAECFRGFLRAVASGKLAFGDALPEALGLEPEVVEQGFYLWLRRKAAANGIPYSAR